MASTFPDVQVNGYRYTDNETWDVLLNASANQTSIKAASEWLQDASSANWICTYLKTEVFELCGLDCIERCGNGSLESTFPKRLKKSSRQVAIDLVLIPFYSDVATYGIYRSKARRSTIKFFCYASAHICLGGHPHVFGLSALCRGIPARVRHKNKPPNHEPGQRKNNVHKPGAEAPAGCPRSNAAFVPP